MGLTKEKTTAKGKEVAWQKATTITLPKRVFQRVEKLATATKRTPDAVVARILKERLDYEEYALRQIEEGLADIKAGRVIPHEKFWEALEEARHAKKRSKS